jgi:hypothetical protein
MEAHGCTDRYTAQRMEHANMEVKQGYRQGSKHYNGKASHARASSRREKLGKFSSATQYATTFMDPSIVPNHK